MDYTILRVEDLQVTISGRNILRDISLEIKSGEQWAVFGEAGSGKTVLAHTLAGGHVFRGRVDFPHHPDPGSDELVMVVEQQHRFRDLQNQSNFYYQQRYNAFDSEATITVAEDLAAFEEGHFGKLSMKEMLKAFHLVPILDEPLIRLSSGENKRLQILKAVLGRHRLLILDEPYTGLDVTGRRLLDDVLVKLADAGQSLLLLSSRDHVPTCFNRFARLAEGCFVLQKSPDEWLNQISKSHGARPMDFPASLPYSYPDFRYALVMDQVRVQYGDKLILDGISWQVEKGSCWSLTGPNGAGKSTLLSLITADNPQAYANKICLFDRKRGSGESIWDIKQKIGYLSPELHLYFDPAATAFSAIASGFFDTIGLFRSLNPQQEQVVWEWLQFLGCASAADRLLNGLPTGMQRLILLARALVKSPPLLILDEPCQGLDATQTKFTLDLIDQYCRRQAAGLIFVSHYIGEFPDCIHAQLKLEKGRMV